MFFRYPVNSGTFSTLIADFFQIGTINDVWLRTEEDKWFDPEFQKFIRRKNNQSMTDTSGHLLFQFLRKIVTQSFLRLSLFPEDILTEEIELEKIR